MGCWRLRILDKEERGYKKDTGFRTRMDASSEAVDRGNTLWGHSRLTGNTVAMSVASHHSDASSSYRKQQTGMYFESVECRYLSSSYRIANEFALHSKLMGWNRLATQGRERKQDHRSEDQTSPPQRQKLTLQAHLCRLCHPPRPDSLNLQVIVA